MCVKSYNTWPCLTSFGVSVARSSGCTLGPHWITVCFCWTAGPHIWATCVFETQSPNETHIGLQKCCVCSCIPGSKLTGWQRGDDCHDSNGIPGIIWWTSRYYSFISFWIVWKLCYCVCFSCLVAVTVIFWQRAAVSHLKTHTCSVLVSDQSHMPNTSHGVKLITLYLICLI